MFKVLALAVSAAIFGVSAVQSQTLGGPRELPPASFKGAQYIDSRGCVFLRAGIGGRVTWVPRITADRKQLCRGAAAPMAEPVVTARVAPPARAKAAQPKATYSSSRARPAVGMPMETIASLPPRPVAPPPAAASAARLQSGCPASAPYGARVTLADGRASLICSADAGFDVQAAAARAVAAQAAPAPAPRPAAPQAKLAASGGYVCPADAPVARRYQIRSGGSTVLCTAADGGLETATPPLALGGRAMASDDGVVVPKGYRKAWDDGRLNPNRGKGTALGQAQQDQIWTREVPAKLAAAPKKVTRAGKTYVTAASNLPQRKQAVSRGYYVQVGTFGEAGNARRTAQRLQSMGLPVAVSPLNRKGRKLQNVMAGPFASASAAQAALSQARRSGFGDAFIR